MNLNPQICVRLFDQALNETGFTTFHSYLMLKEGSRLLEVSYDIMESSKQYSIKQLDYVSTFLTVKPIHNHLMKEGGLVSDFDANDKKRYTHVIVDSESDDPLLCLLYTSPSPRD